MQTALRSPQNRRGSARAAALRRLLSLAAAMLVVAGAAGCSDSGSGGGGGDDAFGDPGDCIVVEMASSPEKIDLMTDLAQSFNGSDGAKLGDKCVFVRPQRKSSGGAAQLLTTSWNEDAEGPQPVIWSPAGSTWGQVVNQRLRDGGRDPIVGEGKPFMLTPLVIAMPKPMADALGHPATVLGWSDILDLARNQAGWGAFGHPEWGPFRLGKTNPNFSTSGLNALIAQADAAMGKTTGLSLEDLEQPQFTTFAEGVESAVVHYGDTTLTFLNNLYRADQRGSALNYVSAVAIEEKSVIDYNLGNPDGVLDPGEEPRPPRTPLVAIYPKEGTLFSDNPLFVLDAPWVSDEQKDAAALFVDYVQKPENQRRVLDFHFRPGNPDVAVDDPITKANGVDPDQPQTLLDVPSADVVSRLIDKWSMQRKKARVTLVLDVSGSMSDNADPDNPDAGTKLDLAKRAAIDAIDLFSPDDEVSLEVFSTDLFGNAGQMVAELVPSGRVADIGEQLRSKIQGLSPQGGTPLYEVTQQAYEAALAGFDPARINAVVLLTDGRNEDGNPGDDVEQLQTLLTSLRSGNEGQAGRPVRVFPIAYGADADADTLRSVAEAATSALYTSTDPTTITQVLTNVISNF